MMRFLSVSDQLWKQLQNGTLINKGSKWRFQKTKFEIPQDGGEHFIQKQNSEKVIDIRKKSGKVTDIVNLRQRDSSDYQKWIRQPASNGWFTLKNAKTGQLLSAITRFSKGTVVSGNFFIC